MECSMNIFNRKIKMRQEATWVISAVKTFPILTYHVLIMAWLALVAKIVWINSKQQHFTSGYITYMMRNWKMNPIHGTRLLISVRRMDCVMVTCIIQTHKIQYIFTSTDGLRELHQCCFTKGNWWHHRGNKIKPCNCGLSEIVMMSMLVKTWQAFLQVLATSTRKQALALIKTMSNQQLNVICEILINIQYGNVPVNDTVKKKLQRK